MQAVEYVYGSMSPYHPSSAMIHYDSEVANEELQDFFTRSTSMSLDNGSRIPAGDDDQFGVGLFAIKGKKLDELPRIIDGFPELHKKYYIWAKCQEKYSELDEVEWFDIFWKNVGFDSEWYDSLNGELPPIPDDYDVEVVKIYRGGEPNKVLNREDFDGEDVVDLGEDALTLES